MQLGEAQLREASEALRCILNGCLNTSTIKQSQQQLMNISNDPHFVTYLCYLIPSADHNLLSMIMTTLKNYVMARYNSPENPMPEGQKEFLRNNIFKIFYQVYPQVAPIKIYKEVMQAIILVSYPWPTIANIIEEDLQGSIVASVFFFRQVAKANEYIVGEERKGFEQFASRYFPNLEGIVEKIFTNYNESTAELLFEALKTFYSAFHIEVLYHLRNFAVLDKWILFTETILNAPAEPISLKSQQLAARIYLKLFMLYANDSQDGKEYKGWAREFRSRYCQRIFQHVINLIGERKGGEDLQSTLINCLYQVVKEPTLQPLFTNQHCEVLLYGNVLLPLCQASTEELNLFRNDAIEYVHREDDLTCASLRRAVLDLVENVVDKLSFDGKSELMRMVEYSARVLQSNASDPEKQVILRVLAKIGKIVLRNKFLKSKFQDLTVQFFIPMLSNPNPLLSSLTLDLLSRYLPFGELDNQTVAQLMELIYGHITNSQFLVLRFYAISAFTALLQHRAALEAAAPHFSRILQIYVGMLNSFEHESLIGCLESIVKYFSKEVVTFAPELISHLVNLFASLCKNKNQQADEDEDEPDGNSPATAALSTITQLLECSLSPEVYHKVSAQITELFRGIFSVYSQYFDAILSLFNVLVHHATMIVDFNYPYIACRKLLEGDNSLLSLAQLPHEIAVELSAAEKADSELQEDIISILKNLIQKMPDELLRRYPFPTHPQLLLCLIENKRLTNEEIFRLNTNQIIPPWLPYIYAYTHLLYGIGEGPAPIQQVKPVVGISFFPWFQQRLTPELVKLVIKACEVEEEEDDDLYEDNTAQLLEKYANEDEQEDEDDYNEGSGINYSYHYDSPFDSSKDKDTLIQALKNMSQADALALSNTLSPKHRKKLETLFY